MMKFKTFLGLYLVFLVVMVLVPLGELNTTLSDTFVFELRLDYLVHVLVFAPVVVLWKLGFPRHSMWVIMGVGVVLAVGLEGVQYLLPYRSWNVNDAVGNVVGVVLGGAGSGLRYCRYFAVTKGKNRAISRAEVLGRLCFCGFDIVAKQVIDNRRTPPVSVTPHQGENDDIYT
ncbi:MAG: VanZ family protein [Desulfobacteraceae bacterium]|nr:VanZ family protein [Desulfobacteraceae bacterium]